MKLYNRAGNTLIKLYSSIEKTLMKLYNDKKSPVSIKRGDTHVSQKKNR